MKLIKTKRDNTPQTIEENLKQIFITGDKLSLFLTNSSAWILAFKAVQTAQAVANGKGDATVQSIMLVASVAVFIGAIGFARNEKNMRNDYLNNKKEIEKSWQAYVDAKNKEKETISASKIAQTENDKETTK